MGFSENKDFTIILWTDQAHLLTTQIVFNNTRNIEIRDLSR